MPIKKGKDGVRRHFHHIVKKDGNPGLVQVKKEEYAGTPYAGASPYPVARRKRAASRKEYKSLLPHYLDHGGQGDDAYPYAFSGARFTNAFGRDWEKHHYPTKTSTRGPLRFKLMPGEPRRRRAPGPQPKRKRRSTRARSTKRGRTELPHYLNHGGLGNDAFPYAFSGAKWTNDRGRLWEKHHYPVKGKSRGPLRFKLVR